MAVTASVQPAPGHIVYARSDFPHPIQFSISKDGMDYIVRNRPGSDLDGLVRVWTTASGLQASRCAGIIGPGFWQDATRPLRVSHIQTQLRSSTDVLDHICSVVEHKVNRTQVYKRCLLMFLVRQPFSKSPLIGQFTNDSDRGLCILNVS